MAGARPLRDLRGLKDVTIPEGTQEIGEQWFWYSKIESVTVPASLREIRTDSFYNCEGLKSVTFAPGSRLETIGPRSFSNTAIEKVVIPKGVTEIQKCAFKDCGDLK